MATQPYLGSIATFAFPFAPRGYQLCQGQILSISQFTALFSLLGTTYGGNGQSTFGLPDLRGRVPLGVGQGTGGSNYVQGQTGGTETVTLTVPQMPAHNHNFNTLDVKATTNEAAAGSWLARSRDAGTIGAEPEIYVPTGTTGTTVPLNVAAISVAGQTQPHPNLQPFLALNFSIAVQGVFPSRN